MEKNGVIINDEQYREVLEKIQKRNESKEEKIRKILEIKKEAIKREKENKNDIGYMVLVELVKIGFNAGYKGTQFFANVIEDIYYELEAYDYSSYFDLSLSDNVHYTYLHDKYKAKQEDFYRSHIIAAIGTSKSDDKNINSLVHTIATTVSEKVKNDNKKSLVLIEEDK